MNWAASPNSFPWLLRDPQVPKDALVEQIKSLEPPDFDEPDEPHRVLAGSPTARLCYAD